MTNEELTARLKAHCKEVGCRPTELIEALVIKYLKDFDRGGIRPTKTVVKTKIVFQFPNRKNLKKNKNK